MSKELVEAIERLGDYLDKTSKLARNIYIMIKKNEGVHRYNADMMNINKCLMNASTYYTYFHGYYLGRLARKH